MGLNKHVLDNYEAMKNRLEQLEKAIGIGPQGDNISVIIPANNPVKPSSANMTEQKVEEVITRMLD